MADTYPHIIHVHGKVPRWDTIVFTQSEYQRAENNRKYSEFWIDVLVKRPLLILGFSGKDPAFRRILSFIDGLGVGHLVAPFVIHSTDFDMSVFGPRAVSLPYDAGDGHGEVGSILRQIRDHLHEERARLGVPENPFDRAGIHPTYTASRDQLLLAMAGVDFRSLCDAESFVALSALMSGLVSNGRTSIDQIVDFTIGRMRVSKTEAKEAANAAVRIAKGRGWIEGEDTAITASGLVPTTSGNQLAQLVTYIQAESQRPVSWSGVPNARAFIEDAVLAYLGTAGGGAARSLMGLEVGKPIDGNHLAQFVTRSSRGIGDSVVERQICGAVVRVMDSPPENLAAECSRLSSFAFVSELTTLGSGRELIRAYSIEKLYLDSNIFLPAVAPGHPWHSRCDALLQRCQRHIPKILILEGFLEEARIQYREAHKLAASTSALKDFQRLALARIQPNVFIDAYAGWVVQSPTASFREYCTAVGLGDDIIARVRGNWSSVSVVAAPKIFGKHAILHAKTQAGMASGNRPGELVRHEADQLGLLALENDGQAWPSARFVTAHTRLREFVAREHMPIARAVVPPVALAHLLAVVHPTTIPPESLREIAFLGNGLEVAETVFAVLLDKWRNDQGKLRKLVTQEVAERFRSILADVAERHSDSIDSRQQLIDLVMNEIVPAVEQSVALAKTSPEITRPPEIGEGIEAASRLAQELVGPVEK